MTNSDFCANLAALSFPHKTCKPVDRIRQALLAKTEVSLSDQQQTSDRHSCVPRGLRKQLVISTPSRNLSGQRPDASQVIAIYLSCFGRASLLARRTRCQKHVGACHCRGLIPTDALEPCCETKKPCGSKVRPARQNAESLSPFPGIVRTYATT